MIQTVNNNTLQNLKNEFRNEYPNLTDAELNSIDESVEKFVSSVSVKIHRNEQAVQEVIREKLQYIHSKAI